ncbi:hypothetical protein GCM10007094_41170 [Pseudovibrio japonicus]|uniref:Uncharacterized protein n=1 Tax=Pseudovibrio japonicus TaxID=366534 RepID=A0ABQ3ES67_9HYPH|nr:hypothetical protein [Pseudovibrio japonicus]GHB47649.1 hypothetical protein GCM10007094_41170 [Pseudovibrio japonicus]
MRTIYFILLLTAIAEFRAEVHGEDSMIGCFIRGLEDIDDGRCKASN